MWLQDECARLEDSVHMTSESSKVARKSLRQELNQMSCEEEVSQANAEAKCALLTSEIHRVRRESLVESQESLDQMDRSERIWQRRVQKLEEELGSATAEVLQQEDLLAELRSEERAQGEAVAGELSAMIAAMRGLQQKHSSAMGSLLEMREALADRGLASDLDPDLLLPIDVDADVATWARDLLNREGRSGT